jgi:hypothetical protein
MGTNDKSISSKSGAVKFASFGFDNCVLLVDSVVSVSRFANEMLGSDKTA